MRRPSGTRSKWRVRMALTPILFLLPSLVGLAVFFVIPTLDVGRRSLFDDAGVRFTGVENYREVIDGEAFQLAAFNTLKFLGVCIPLLLVISLAMALFVYEGTPFRRLTKTVLLLPLALPTFTAALLISITFDANGLLNGIRDYFGIAPAAWLNSDLAFWVLVGDYLWKNIGYCVVLWLAALSCIPEELYQAAHLDGANRLQVFARITLPLLRSSAVVVVILAVINGFKVYREAYLVGGSYPHESMYLLPHLFNNWFAALSLGKLSAGSVVLGVGFVVVVAALFLAWRKGGRFT